MAFLDRLWVFLVNPTLWQSLPCRPCASLWLCRAQGSWLSSCCTGCHFYITAPSRNVLSLVSLFSAFLAWVCHYWSSGSINKSSSWWQIKEVSLLFQTTGNWGMGKELAWNLRYWSLIYFQKQGWNRDVSGKSLRKASVHSETNFSASWSVLHYELLLGSAGGIPSDSRHIDMSAHCNPTPLVFFCQDLRDQQDKEVGCSSNDYQWKELFWALQVKESKSPKASVLHQPHNLGRCFPLKCRGTMLISASIPVMSWDLRCFICSCLKAFPFTFETDSPSPVPCPHRLSSWTCFTSPYPHDADGCVHALLAVS